jgi:hypothetical protein
MSSLPFRTPLLKTGRSIPLLAGEAQAAPLGVSLRASLGTGLARGSEHGPAPFEKPSQCGREASHLNPVSARQSTPHRRLRLALPLLPKE